MEDLEEVDVVVPGVGGVVDMEVGVVAMVEEEEVVSGEAVAVAQTDSGEGLVLGVH